MRSIKHMEPVRYEPGEAIRWLTLGAEDLKDSAGRQGKSVWTRRGERSIGKDIRQVVGAVADLGKGALAEMKHRQAEAAEYLIYSDKIEVLSGNTHRSYKFADVLALKLRDDTLVMVLERGTLEIKPFAHIVSGMVKVPIGWQRNGIEVPYGVLIDEISARTGKSVELE